MTRPARRQKLLLVLHTPRKTNIMEKIFLSPLDLLTSAVVVATSSSLWLDLWYWTWGAGISVLVLTFLFSIHYDDCFGVFRPFIQVSFSFVLWWFVQKKRTAVFCNYNFSVISVAAELRKSLAEKKTLLWKLGKLLKNVLFEFFHFPTLKLLNQIFGIKWEFIRNFQTLWSSYSTHNNKCIFLFCILMIQSLIYLVALISSQDQSWNLIGGFPQGPYIS